ncbi:hypothetical protein [Halobellus rarus]|uniref:HEAT repeat domain-containing protein n=1 Tax=Halobellus rarus TaxID=1126237 RepID=A0ABD6CPA7_9EURY|nr:hypothetical protein [Halobellus rarus]
MTGEESPQSADSISLSADPDDRRALAERLLDRAEDDPESITHEELATIASLLPVDDADGRVAAAEALQHLHDRPELFAPFVEAILAAVEPYPEGVDGIPAPIEWMGSAEIRALVYVSDSLARVAQERPELFVPHADDLRDRLRSEANYPRSLLFVVGYAEATAPGTVPREWLKGELCELLDRGRGNGYPSWAADTLGALGDPDVLPALRESHPGEDGDDPTREAFDDAIETLEAVDGDG